MCFVLAADKYCSSDLLIIYQRFVAIYSDQYKQKPREIECFITGS